MAKFNPSYFDKEYFDGGKGYHTYDYAGRFEDQADKIIEMFNPRSVLDFGCAKGYLVKALRDRGVEAFGYDVSDYALSQAPEEVKPYVGKRMKQVELIVSFDTLEHIDIMDLKATIEKIRKNGRKFYIEVATPNTPDWQHDASHVSVFTIDEWQKLLPEAIWVESL